MGAAKSKKIEEKLPPISLLFMEGKNLCQLLSNDVDDCVKDYILNNEIMEIQIRLKTKSNADGISLDDLMEISCLIYKRGKKTMACKKGKGKKGK